MSTKEKAPRSLRVFQQLMGFCCFVLAIELMIMFFRAAFGGLPHEFVAEFKEGYLYALAVYSIGTVSIQKFYEAESPRRRLPFQFVVIMWFVMVIIFGVMSIHLPRQVGIGLVVELMSVFCWALGLFLSSEMGKKTPLIEVLFERILR